jgi:CSLREA domain-containing protein
MKGAKKQAGTQSILSVTTLEDELNNDGDCSLREAIAAANDNAPVDACPAGEAVFTDTITFNVSGTITLNSQLTVTAGGPLTIDGENGITLGGNGTTRILWVEYGSVLTLKHLTVVNGYAVDGAGLYNNGGTVTMDGCTLSQNIVEGGAGGGIYNNTGTLLLSNSTLSGNVGSVNGGGGIYNGIATLIITDSLLSENSSSNGGGIRNTGGTIMVTHSTLSGNIAGVGGAISNIGSLMMIDSTLSENYTDQVGSAIYSWDGMVIVSNSTLTGNFAGFGGTISYYFGSITATNSIINSYPFGSNCKTQISDGGHNISSDDTCGFDPANGSLPNTDPMLGPLQDNGGPTLTHALLVGSPAIDTGDNVQCPSTDQRGVPRPQDGNGDGLALCDIGAFEKVYQIVSPTLVTITGSSNGLVMQSYPFYAMVASISTSLPLTYTWQASGQAVVTHTNGLTDTINFDWDLPGSKTITVIARNVAGSVVDTHLITIADIPISGLVASNDSPTMLGQTTALSATIQDGSNVTYTWDFGDDEIGSGQFITHTYASIGTYTATVTATNTAGSLPATTQIIITSLTHQQYLPLVIKSPPKALSITPTSSQSDFWILEGLVVLGMMIIGSGNQNKKQKNL